jgi:A/G-specific adenine glycosylase
MLNSSAFRRALLKWYREHGRDLPWRRSRDPYAILVSEFMLQQTQVATVIPYYHEWLRRFPDFSSLALATESEVLHAWQGLGYYARARNLHATAKVVMQEHGGVFPIEPEKMRALPGLGRYTANAVATFAFDQSVPIVEANIARVLARLFDMRLPIDSSAGANKIWDLATSLLPKQNASGFNSALMDLGALVCVARQPKCEICPARGMCAAEHPAELPNKRQRAAIKLLTEHHAFTFDRGRLLLEQSQERWRGMWILPRLTSDPGDGAPLYSAEFPFTNHRVTLAVYRRTRPRTSPHRWFSLDSLDSIPLPSPHRRAVTQLIASALSAT